MSAIVYPASLPTPQTSSVSYAERRLLTTPERPREARALQRDRGTVEQITFPPMRADAYAVFRAWWVDELLMGAAWFAADWPTARGRQTVVRKFIGPLSWGFIAGGFWKISGLCETRGVGELPQIAAPLFFEDFEHGLGLYDLVSGNNVFSLVDTEYGKSLSIASQDDPSPAAIRRTLPGTLVLKRVAFKFKILGIEEDDAGSLQMLTADDSFTFSFNPVREVGFDPMRRPQAFVDGELQTVNPAGALSLGVWYQGAMTLAGFNSTFVLTNLDTQAIVHTTAFTNFHEEIEFGALQFLADSMGQTCPVLYDEISCYA